MIINYDYKFQVLVCTPCNTTTLYFASEKPVTLRCEVNLYSQAIFNL